MTPPPKRSRPQGGSRGGDPRRYGARNTERRQGPRPPELGGDQVEGRRAVLALLTSGTRPVQRVAMAAELESSPQLDEIEAICRKKRVPLDVIPRARLERLATTESHQGVVAKARELRPVLLDDLLAAPGTPFLLLCDGLTDPHNLGSLLRSADGAGVTGVVLPRHRSVRITPTVAKVAAGAIEHLTFATVLTIASSALLLIVAAFHLPDVVVMALMFGSGIIIGASRTPRDLMVKDASPPGQIGKVFGFVSSGLPLGSAITPVPFGFIIDHGHPELVLVLVAAILLLSIFCAGSARSAAGHAAKNLAPAE